MNKFLQTGYLYLFLLAVIAADCWTVIKADIYRQQADGMMRNSYFLQLGAANIRERVAYISGLLRYPNEASKGEIEDEIHRLAPVIIAKTRVHLTIDNIRYFLDSRDIDDLKIALSKLEKETSLRAISDEHQRAVLEQLSKIQAYMMKLSGIMPTTNITLAQAADISRRAGKNNMIFIFILSLFIVTVFFLYHRSLTARRVDRHIRSFASMFAHMTRTRLAAMQLFVESLANDRTPAPEMLMAARETAKEMVSINEGLYNLAHSEITARSSKMAPLGSILDGLSCKHDPYLRIEVDSAARSCAVPQSQFELILEELVLNARDAVMPFRKLTILIRGRVSRRLFFRRQLELTVSDNGIGMNAELLEKAVIPFFSAKGAKHTGLGLTGCIDLLTSMNGKLVLQSEPNIGTKAHIVYRL